MSRSIRVVFEHASSLTTTIWAALAGFLGYSWDLARGGSPMQRSRPSADDIAGHVPEVSATEPFIVTTSIFDEVADICERLGITA